MRDDLEDLERDVASRLEEMKSRESIQLLLNNLYVRFIRYVYKSDVAPRRFQRILNSSSRGRVFYICLLSRCCRLPVSPGLVCLHYIPRHKVY